MAGKKKAEPPVTLEALRDTCVAIAFSVKRGEMTATNANAMTNALRSAIYAEQMRLNRDRADAGGTEDINKGCTVDLTQETKEILDKISEKLVISKEMGEKEG